jgi:hypothetical protein
MAQVGQRVAKRPALVADKRTLFRYLVKPELVH